MEQAIATQEGKFFFPQQEHKRALNNDEQSLCEGELRKNECLEPLKNMVADKSPGTDGLICEFYKMFWETLIHSFNYSYEIGKLSVSQRKDCSFFLILKRPLILWSGPLFVKPSNTLVSAHHC